MQFLIGAGKSPIKCFKKLETLNNGGKTSVSVNWHYEEDDEDMLEAGEDYQAIIDLPVKMIEVEEI